jgi:hypothetical protein
MEGRQRAPSVHWTDVFAYRRPLLVGVGLVVFQQITGQPSVLFYTTDIFKAAGFGAESTVSSFGLGICKLLATTVAVLKVDEYGRRFLLLLGTSGMAVALAALSLAFRFQVCSAAGLAAIADPAQPDVVRCPVADLVLPGVWAHVCLAGLCLYVVSYQVGFGPVNWLIISEIFPLRARGAAIAIAVVTNFLANILMTVTFKSLLNLAGSSVMFAVYCALCGAALAFIGAMVPETKGKTLEEIERLFGFGEPLLSAVEEGEYGSLRRSPRGVVAAGGPYRRMGD